jgi:adenosine deaminase
MHGDGDMSNILVTTMGLSWQNLPQVLGLTNPNVVDLYRFHQSNDRIARIREEFGLQPVDELWVVTTRDKVEHQLVALQQWHNLLEPSDSLFAEIKEWAGLIDASFWPMLKIFQVSGTDDMATENECRVMKEALLRIVLHAAEYATGGQLLLSFAGGSNAMSAGMQFAAALFGCDAMIHAVDNVMLPLNPTDPACLTPGQFTASLPADFSATVTLLVSGKFPRNALVGMSLVDRGPIQASDYPIVGSENGKVALLQVNLDELFLTEAVENRMKNAESLACFYTNTLFGEDNGPNFQSLYSLSPWMIEQLKTTRIGVYPEKEISELEWLKKLPKSALHCHLEGVLDPRELIRVANANYLLVDRFKMRTAFQIREWRRLLDRFSITDFLEQYPLKTIADAVRDIPEPVSLCAFIHLFNGAPDFLEEMIYGNKRIESEFVSTGINAYEALGDLQGARLLQSEASIRETCRILVEKAVLHNVRYLEIRCSPVKYVAGGLNPIQIVDMIEEEVGKSFKDFSIVFTAGRHKLKADLLQLVNLAKRITENTKGHCRLRGFDLAENEATSPARDLRKYFFPTMEKCQHVTINAGGNPDIASIWETVYHLNAERISHCLTLGNSATLTAELLDRNIAIEMSPSSNFQIIGFKDNYIPETESKPEYPLKDYLDKGFKVTVNADNPGISRTDFSRELHRAARLTSGGLSIWDTLKIVQNGFKTSFAEHATRNRMLRDAEKEIIALILEGISL